MKRRQQLMVYKVTTKDPKGKTQIVYLRNKDSVNVYTRRLPDYMTLSAIEYVLVPSLKQEFLLWINRQIKEAQS